MVIKKSFVLLSADVMALTSIFLYPIKNKESHCKVSVPFVFSSLLQSPKIKKKAKGAKMSKKPTLILVFEVGNCGTTQNHSYTIFTFLTQCAISGTGK